MNKKIAVIVVVAILAVSIAAGLGFYYMNSNEAQQGTYIIIGTLAYAPGHAIHLGISATSISPNISHAPTTRTFIEPTGLNDSVASFVFLNFQPDLYYPANSTSLKIDFPTGYNQSNTVTVTGQMSYNTSFQAYVMNVTSISQYSS